MTLVLTAALMETVIVMRATQEETAVTVLQGSIEVKMESSV